MLRGFGDYQEVEVQRRGWSLRRRRRSGRRLTTTSRSTSDDSSQVARSWPFPWRSRSTSTNVDDDVDLDSSVELDGSEAIRRRLTPPSTSTSPPLSAPSRLAAQDRSTSNVDGGLNVVRRRRPQRSGSTIRSTSTITNAISKTCDESSDGHVNLNDGRQRQGPGRRPPDAGRS